MKKLKPQLVNSKKGNYYWRIKSSNGRIFSTAETFVSQSNALRSLRSFIEHAQDMAIDDIEFINEK